MPNSSLTEREQVVTRRRLLDLAVGYPRFVGPEWLATLRDADGPRELQAAYRDRFPEPPGPSSERTPSPTLIEENLIAIMLDFLQLPTSLAGNCFVVHSGSAALERAITVTVPLCEAVRLPTPVFDVIPGFLRERSARVRWWELDWTRPQWASAGRSLAGTRSSILVTPDNPSGNAASTADLVALSAAADRAGCTLVVDQSLAVLSRDGHRAPLLADVADPRSAWIMLWDTGKTFDLCGDKVGLMIVGDPLKDQVRAALSLVQYSLSSRLMTLMTLVIARATECGYLKWLTALRRANEEVLAHFGRDLPADVRVPPFGAFALVDTGKADSEALIGRAGQKGLGLISTSSFTLGTPLHNQTRPFLRIPLLREPTIMHESLDKLSALLQLSHYESGYE